MHRLIHADYAVPMTFWEKVIFWVGLFIVWGFPLFFLIQGFQWFLLIVYALTVAGFFMTLKTFLCSQCINFACPLNTVEDEIRNAFLKQNPGISRAWGIDTNEETQ